ncbi:MAG: CARDB domain-containing protein [Chloroflexota bacterium]|nr:CARDB domain-containing protein [Chloroflexota bacterium]
MIYHNKSFSVLGKMFIVGCTLGLLISPFQTVLADPDVDPSVPAEYPDLTITGISPGTTNILEDEEFEVTITVSNVGDSVVSGFRLDVYKDRTAAPEESDIGDIHTWVNEEIVVGDSRNVVLPIRYESKGTYQLWAQVDQDNAVVELDEDNNVAGPEEIIVEEPDTPLFSPDLTITSIDVPSTPIPAGEEIVVTVTVRNQGLLGAEDFQVGLYPDRNAEPSPNDPPKYSQAVNRLVAQWSTGVEFTIEYDTPGVYQLWSLVDGDRQVEEQNETNNVAGPESITVIVPQTWTLSISSSDGGSVSEPGEGRFSGNDGIKVKIEATPDSHYEFTEWTGDVDTIEDKEAASTTITLDEDYSITANFALKNTKPKAEDDSYSIGHDDILNEPDPGVLKNDSDPDGDEITAVLITEPSDGNLNLESDGSFSYTPDEGFSGTDTFVYKANDGAEDSNPATVYIEVGDDPADVPDLAITKVDPSPITGIVGEPIDVTVSIENLGSVDPGYWFWGWVYKDRTGPPQDGDTGDSSFAVDGLEPRESIDNTVTLTYDEAGIYQLWVYLDVPPEAGETRDSNNLFGPIQVTIDEEADPDVPSNNTNNDTPDSSDTNVNSSAGSEDNDSNQNQGLVAQGGDSNGDSGPPDWIWLLIAVGIVIPAATVLLLMTRSSPPIDSPTE